MSIIYEHLSQGGCEDFNVLLDDGRALNVRVSDEGIVMDVFGLQDDLHLGTVGMMFDEWADWIVREDIQP
mgnify:FL=1